MRLSPGAAALAVKWLISHRGEDTAAYVLLVAFAAVMLVAYLRHTHRQNTDLAVFEADPEERADLLARLPPGQAASLRFRMGSFEDLDLAEAPPPVEFRYPEASRSFNTALFWLAVVFAAGFTWPVARGQIDDAGSAGVMLALAALMFLSALGYRATHRWAGRSLLLDEDGMTERLADGDETRLTWSELVSVQYHRWPGVVDYRDGVGQRIRVWLTLQDFAHFVELTLVHRHRRSSQGAV